MIKFTHCYITVSNITEAIEFYSKIFGKPTYVETNSWASWFNGQFGINLDSSATYGDNTIPGFEVNSEEELESLYQLLLNNNIKVTKPEEVKNTPGYFYKYIWLTDIYGNTLEFAYTTKNQ